MRLLRSVQNDLFDVGADLCTPIVAGPASSRRCGSPRPTSTRLEAGATRYNEALPKLRPFILPGGTPGAALLHVARTVARRAERCVGRCWRSTPSAPTR